MVICERTGDDEKLYLWDVDKKRVRQVFADEMARWGQITCMKWLSGVSDREALCFGTGRGLVLVYYYSTEVVCLDLLNGLGTHIQVVIITGVTTRAGSRVRGSRVRVWVTIFSPVTFPYPFGRVTGL